MKRYRAELEEAVWFALRAPFELHEDEPAMRGWEGIFRLEILNASAELRIIRSESDCYWVSGLALWGTQDRDCPHTGEVDASARIEGDCLVLKEQDYVLSMTLTSSGLSVQETCELGMFGMNVTFEGQYRRVPTGGEALPQPEMRPFESEFWPEEGIPVFEAKCDRLALRARPSSDTPVIGHLSTVPGSRILFSGFRYRTLRPGRVVIHQVYTLVGRNLGQTDYLSLSNYYHDGGELITLQLRPNDSAGVPAV